MSRSVQELVVGLALTAISVIALISVQAGDDSAFESARRAAMTAKAWPTILASGLGILSLLFTIGALRRVRTDSASDVIPLKEFLFGRTTLITIGVIAILIAYAFLLKQVHFGLLTFGFLFVGFFLFGQRNMVRNSIVAACSAAVFYALFVLLLELPLDPS